MDNFNYGSSLVDNDNYGSSLIENNNEEMYQDDSDNEERIEVPPAQHHDLSRCFNGHEIDVFTGLPQGYSSVTCDLCSA